MTNDSDERAMTFSSVRVAAEMAKPYRKCVCPDCRSHAVVGDSCTYHAIGFDNAYWQK